MIYLIIPSFVWAFSYGLIKTNLGSLDPNFVATARILCATMIFLPFLKMRRLSLTQALQFAGIGAIQYGLMYISFLYSFKYLDAYQIALFTTFTPFYVILCNDIFNRKFNPYYMKIGILAVIGGAIIYYKNLDQSNLLQGFLLVQVADICFAFGQVTYKRLKTTVTEVRNVEVYALLFIGALVMTSISTTLSAGWSSLNDVTTQQFWVILYLGAVASGLCFFLWNKGAVTTNTATLAVFNNIKSPLAILVSILFFHEVTDLVRLTIGLSVIILALVLAERRSRKEVAL